MTEISVSSCNMQSSIAKKRNPLPKKDEATAFQEQLGSGGAALALFYGCRTLKQMEELSVTMASPPAVSNWWQRVFRHKSAGRIGLDLILFVMGVLFIYVVDLTVLSRSAPLVFRYMIDLVLYLNHHAVAAVEMLY